MFQILEIWSHFLVVSLSCWSIQRHKLSPTLSTLFSLAFAAKITINFWCDQRCLRISLIKILWYDFRTFCLFGIFLLSYSVRYLSSSTLFSLLHTPSLFLFVPRTLSLSPPFLFYLSLFFSFLTLPFFIVISSSFSPCSSFWSNIVVYFVYSFRSTAYSVSYSRVCTDVTKNNKHTLVRSHSCFQMKKIISCLVSLPKPSLMSFDTE